MATRMQQRKGTAAQWAAADPILNAGEIGWESDTNKFKIGDGINHWDDLTYFLDSTDTGFNSADYIQVTDKNAVNGVAGLDADANVLTKTGVVFEGATADAYETTLAVTDPTADRTITLPNATGTVVVADNSGNVTISGNLTVQGETTQVELTNVNVVNSFTFEGPTANSFETTLAVVDPTADRTVTIPDTTGTIITTGNLSAITSIGNNATMANPTISNPTFIEGGLTFEGATANDFETLLAVTDPTADRTITLPDVTGTVITTGNLSDITSLGVVSSVVFEGTTNDAFELTLAGGDPTADRTVSFPDAGGVVVVDTAEQTLTNKTLTSPVVSNLQITDGSIVLEGSSPDNFETTLTVTDPTADRTISFPDVTGTVVTTGDSGTVTSTMIANGTIVDADINASAAIDWTKLAISSTVSSTELGYVDGVTSSIQNQLDAKLASSTASSTYAPIANPTFTGTVAGITKSMVGLANVDNTTDANKPVSTATQTALDAKLALAGGTMTGALTLSGAPSSDLHAATKLYVDNVVAGINFHEAVRVATTANITLSGTQTIDGVSVSAGNRVLVKDQTDQKTNGIYVVDASTWSRAADADNTPAGELKGGDFCLVLEGGQAGYGYVCSNTGTVTIGSTNITYVAFNAAKAVVAGNGLQELTPGELSIDTSITQTRVSGVSDTEIGYLDGVTSAIQTQLNAKAPTASPTFTGTVTVAANGIAFTDGTQTAEGVPSRTPIIQKTSSYTLSALTERDDLIEMGSSSALTLTIPLNSAVAFPIGTSLDILQTSTGQVTIAGAAGVTVNATPGLKLRTQWSSATLFKRAENTWVVYGDLTA
jgi:hypothetical protein